ncbi:hypothetical protein HNV08_11410 [Winogradskyella eckloniae]|uniref:hypothetical protein n=1 Tax=Winogradskyella eckloniae TaxID=1089306 RepID=UPI0015667722|nr:hypothetical protein [Winogradskyella eckloniae]NRD20657.1 hypothetical protein [Winogradskyella eckloniae]
MQTNPLDKIKINLFRITTVVILMGYFFSLMPTRLHHILHSISHYIDASSLVFQQEDLNTNDSNGTLVVLSGSRNIQHSHEHNHEHNHSHDHKHNVIDFLDLVINNTFNKENKHQGESVIDLKISKYSMPYASGLVIQYLERESSEVSLEKPTFFKNRFLDQRFKPPKV